MPTGSPERGEPFAAEVKPDVSPDPAQAARELRRILEERDLATVFQPIYGFRERGIVGHESLARGPRGSCLREPEALFGAAEREGLVVEIGLLCVQQMLRAFAESGLPGNLFLNVSPRLVERGAHDQQRAARFLEGLGLEAGRVVIELTEDYPTADFRQVREALMLYRSMGFRIAIDDLGEGFASLRLWSELRPEYVKADRHFVTGIAQDPVKLQFLRAIQHIAENSGSQVIAEGIESAADFRVVRDLGVGFGQGWFLGRPHEKPEGRLPEEAQRAQDDVRVPVWPASRGRGDSEAHARDFVRAVEPARPEAPLASLAPRFAADVSLPSIPLASEGAVLGVVSRTWLESDAGGPARAALLERPCIELADRSPIRVDAGMDLAELTALLAQSDARRFADGFVIVSGERYLGMGASRDVLRALQSSRMLASRYTNPLTLLPGQVPINEHLERLIARRVPFTAWFVEIDPLRGLNEVSGFVQGDALIQATAREIERACDPAVDFAGHVSGARFVVLAQSADWKARAQALLESFPALLAAHVPRDALTKGHFALRAAGGRDVLRPLPKLAVGIVSAAPGQFASRNEVVEAARRAAEAAQAAPASALHVEDEAASLLSAPLFGSDRP